MGKDWGSVAATVKRLIEANGRSVTLYKQGNVAQDSEKPWRGEADYPEGSVTGLAVFVPARGSGLGLAAMNEDNVKRAEQVMLFAAANDTGLDLEEFDLARDGGQDWKIVSTEVLSPAGTRLLYSFGVTR